MTARIELLPGTKFGRWTVLGVAAAGTATRPYRLNVRCGCGTEREVAAKELRTGKSKSCGCLMREINASAFITHGELIGRKYTPEYRAWAGAKDRCHNPKTLRWYDYGGRGIAMCQRWRDSFADFLSDMGRRPSPRHSLDRFPNNDGNYEPGNCRWATAQEQRANQRARAKVAQLRNFTEAELLAELKRRGWTPA